MKSALIVDGEPSIGGILEEVLKSEGMETVTMAHGSEATDYARAQKFDVVFVDSSSPLSDGIELTRKIRRSGYNHRTPIVMITTPKYTGFLTEGFEAGASFMIYKPIDRTRLQRLVRLMQGVIENEIRRFRRVVVEVKALIQSGGDEVQAATVGEALSALTNKFGELKKHLYSDDGRLRSFVNVYVNDEDIRYLQKDQTNLREGDTISIVPSIAGGTRNLN